MSSATRFLVVLVLGPLSLCARADPEAEQDAARALEFAIAMRGAVVERAHVLRDQLPKDLRTRVLLSPSLFITDATGSLLLGSDAELPALVEQARGSMDPVILSQLVGRCPRRAGVEPCDALEMAQRWVNADTQNQVAWLALGNVQRERKDEPAAREAFLRASQASVWQDYYVETGRYLLRRLPKDMPASARSQALRTIQTTASTSSVHLPFGFLIAECKDPQLVAACHKILAVIARDAETLMARSWSARLSKTSGVPAQIVEDRYRQYDATLAGLRLAQPPSIDDDSTSDADYAAFNKVIEALLTRGEVAQARSNLDATGSSVDEAISTTRAERLEREKRLESSTRPKPG